jgi:hypothetical protein
MWSIRLYVTALLRNALRSGLASGECSCWCEVWAPDGAGQLIDSAHLDPETGVIEWESDMNTAAGELRAERETRMRNEQWWSLLDNEVQALLGSEAFPRLSAIDRTVVLDDLDGVFDHALTTHLDGLAARITLSGAGSHPRGDERHRRDRDSRPHISAGTTGMGYPPPARCRR